MTSANGFPTITTYTGKIMDFEGPKPESICIEDIAHALSQVCRFAGQSKDFYSVAQHSVLVSEHLKGVGHLWEKAERQLRQIALLHDAAEAYMGDLARPLKKLLPQYSEIEDRVFKAIAERFKLMYDAVPQLIKDMDRQMLANEGDSFMPPGWDDVGVLPDPRIGKIRSLPPNMAEEFFLVRYYELFGEAKK